MNIDDILRFKPPKETYYDILGCSASSNVSISNLLHLRFINLLNVPLIKLDQINNEYRRKALQYHPDKNPDPESLEKFRKIQEAKDVLTDNGLKRSYDHWLNSHIHIPFEQWRNRKGPTMHWASTNARTLSIKANSSRQRSDAREDSDDSAPNRRRLSNNKSLLDKFRNYEI